MATKPKASKHPAPPAIVHKSYVSSEAASVSDTERTVRFRITTDAVDREKDVVDPKGWHTDEFMQNPVVLFGHDYRSLPVARALSVTGDEHGLSMVAQFPPAEVYPFADTVYQMVKAGFLNATSVGFKPLKHVYDEQRGGMDFHEQTLLEVSVVPVPANPQALIEQRTLGFDSAQLREWAATIIKTLEPDTPGDPPASDAMEPPVEPPPALADTQRAVSGPTVSALRDRVSALLTTVTELQTLLADDDTTGQDEAETPPAPEAPDVVVPPPDVPADPPVLTVTDDTQADLEKALTVFRLVDDPEPRIVIDPAMVSEAIARGYVTSLTAVVASRVDAALSALRGRID